MVARNGSCATASALGGFVFVWLKVGGQVSHRSGFGHGSQPVAACPGRLEPASARDGGNMNEHQALRISGTDPAPVAPFTMGETPEPPAQAVIARPETGQGAQGTRSGVFAVPPEDAGRGWGLVLIDLVDPPRSLTLSDGAVIGSASRDARVEGSGIAPEHHVQVNDPLDGCYVEDLGSPEGTFVGGVRARRINVMHGDVVRLGRQLAVFVERDLAAYTGPVERSGVLVHGPKQRRDWIGPVLDLARSGSCVCIEGGPGVGKRSLARLAATLREARGRGDRHRRQGERGRSAPPARTARGRRPRRSSRPARGRPPGWSSARRPRTRPDQLEIRARGGPRWPCASIIATVSQPLDRVYGRRPRRALVRHAVLGQAHRRPLARRPARGHPPHRPRRLRASPDPARSPRSGSSSRPSSAAPAGRAASPSFRGRHRPAPPAREAEPEEPALRGLHLRRAGPPLRASNPRSRPRPIPVWPAPAWRTRWPAPTARWPRPRAPSACPGRPSTREADRLGLDIARRKAREPEDEAAPRPSPGLEEGARSFVQCPLIRRPPSLYSMGPSARPVMNWFTTPSGHSRKSSADPRSRTTPW